MPTEWKTGDTHEPITGILTANGTPVNLSTATQLRFIGKIGATTIAGTAATVNGGTLGEWSYQWDSDDLTIPTLDIGTGTDNLEIEIEVTWTGGAIQTFPSARANNPRASISEDLD